MSTQPTSQISPERLRRGAILGFIVVFAAFQIVFPLTQLLTHAPPAAFSWQMYTSMPRVPRFTVLLQNGSEQQINLLDYVGSLRSEVNYEQFLPPHLCRSIPTARLVRHWRPNDPQPTVFLCGS